MERAARSPGGIAAKVLLAVALIAYPVLVWCGLEHGSPRALAGVLLCILMPIVALRMRRSARTGLRGVAAVPLVTVAALALSAALDRAGFLLLVPPTVNAIFLFAFAWSLRRGSMPMIERFARLQEDTLSAEQRAWCRLWTILWCLFIFANGTTALVLAFAAPLSWWATYNGLIAYVLMGTMFAVEWTLRRRRFSRG